MSGLLDQAERDRFVFEQEKNLSVIAPAGVGKTRAIIDRIAHLARQPEAVAVDRLPRLIVVTYSVRAAQQMQQKARVAIRAAAVSSRVQRAFQQTFFGTIHSYCVRLLDRFGHYLGLPSPVALLQAEDDLWNRFLLHGLGAELSSQAQGPDLFHFYAPEKLYALGREISPGADLAVGPLPALSCRRLLDYGDSSLHPATRKSIARAQEAVRQWSEAWARGDRFRPLPKGPASEKAAAFAAIWNETFAPWQAWLREAALAFGRRVANAYERFRLAEAVMTYDDQVRLALRALEHPAVRRELAAERLSVLLDEAQDTDPRQFEVLLRVAGLGRGPEQGTDSSTALGMTESYQAGVGHSDRSRAGEFGPEENVARGVVEESVRKGAARVSVVAVDLRATVGERAAEEGTVARRSTATTEFISSLKASGAAMSRKDNEVIPTGAEPESLVQEKTSPEAQGRNRSAKAGEQGGDQTFCMVGDFQQAIYAPRSDLARYQRVDEAISTGPRGRRSRLQVTFRCDRAIIAFVNRIFPAVLTGAGGQCAFVPLEPRAEAGPGQVARWRCPGAPEPPPGKKITAELRARHEARFVAEQILKLGPAGLGASGWAQVAVLCPRRNWLLDLQRELVARGLPVQLHSSNEPQRDRTPGAWLTALLWVAAHPEDTFEIAGVLREIFGVPDHDLAVYTEGDGDRLRLDRPASRSDGPVQTAWQILREACAGAEAVPLHQAVQTILEKTQLRARLHSIPEMALENAGRELDDFLALVAERSAAGTALAALAEELRLGLAQAHPAEEEIREALQLLTAHKAKGLEWETVIVPYVFRAIESKALPYPRLVRLEEGREMVCRDQADFAGQARDFVLARERQQLQRLLYVTCTRAKRTLLLLDDQALFAGQPKRGGWSAGELLALAGGVNGGAWEELSDVLAPPGPWPPAASVPAPALMPLPELAPEDVRRAVARALAMPRRVTPHALAVRATGDAEPERRQEREDGAVAGETAGILYGTWWHDFIQRVPWSQPEEAWQRRFLRAQAHSPHPARSQREWELFRRSRLAQWLAQPGRLVQVELPFLWRGPDGACLEGVMDLAVYAPEEAAWRVIDWKTNRIGPEGSAGLAEAYRGQIEAYGRVLRAMLAAEVKGSLYLTRTGEWVEW